MGSVIICLVAVNIVMALRNNEEREVY
jgi:hypothetical protein